MALGVHFSLDRFRLQTDRVYPFLVAALKKNWYHSDLPYEDHWYNTTQLKLHYFLVQSCIRDRPETNTV